MDNKRIDRKVLDKLILKARLGAVSMFVLLIIILYSFFPFTKSLVASFFVTVIAVFLFEIFVSPQIKTLRKQVERLEWLAEEQSKSAKMLVRRDLELSRVTEKMRELDNIKSNFISVVAHQLRTPLSGIKWTLNMLLSGELGQLTNDQQTFLLKSYESNDRMINLVNDMLGADRVQSGKIQYNFRSVSIVDLLDNLLFEIAPQAEAKKISIKFQDDFLKMKGADANIFADPDTMRAVLQNLLENSVKYTKKNGTIMIDLRKDNNYLILSIADDGIGIPADEQGSVFNRFFRASNAVKIETDGSGLGLFIAKSVVERHGGKIWFESKEGKGTTFFVSIPVKNLVDNNKKQEY